MLDTFRRTIMVATKVRYNLRTKRLQKGRSDNFAYNIRQKSRVRKLPKIADLVSNLWRHSPGSWRIQGHILAYAYADEPSNCPTAAAPFLLTGSACLGPVEPIDDCQYTVISPSSLSLSSPPFPQSRFRLLRAARTST